MIIEVTLNVKTQTYGPGTKLDLFTDKILGVSSSQHLGTVLLLVGGTSLLVQETKEQVLKAITSTIESASKKGEDE